MTGKTIRHIIAMASLVAMLVLGFSTEAGAQTDGKLTISNNTACRVTVCGPQGNNCIALFPGSNVQLTIPCDVTTLTIEVCGTLRKISLGDCISGVNVGGCCADVCYVPGIVGCTSFLIFDPSDQRCPCITSDLE